MHNIAFRRVKEPRDGSVPSHAIAQYHIPAPDYAGQVLKTDAEDWLIRFDSRERRDARRHDVLRHAKR